MRELTIATRPPGAADRSRDGSSPTGHGLIPLPVPALDTVLPSLGGHLADPVFFDFSWFVAPFQPLKINLRQAIADLAAILHTRHGGAPTVNDRIGTLDPTLFSEIDVVLDLCQDMGRLSLEEAQERLKHDAFRMRTVLKTVAAALDTALALSDEAPEHHLTRTDTRRVGLLRCRALIAGLDARVRLLSGSPGHAHEEFDALCHTITTEAHRLLADWLAGVDLRDVAGIDQLDPLLDQMARIDGITPYARLKHSYFTLPSLPDTPDSGYFHRSVDLAAIPAQKPILSGFSVPSQKKVRVRKGQIICKISSQAEIADRDGYIIEQHNSLWSILAIDGPTPPIPDLADHVASLAALMDDIRAMAKTIAFATQFPGETHTIIRHTALLPESKNGIFLLRRGDWGETAP